MAKKIVAAGRIKNKREMEADRYRSVPGYIFASGTIDIGHFQKVRPEETAENRKDHIAQTVVFYNPNITSIARTDHFDTGTTEGK